VVRPGRELEYQREKGAELGWRLKVGETVAYSSPLALIKGLWTFQFISDSSTNGPSDPELSSSVRLLIFALWVLVLVLAAPPGFHLFRWLNSRRKMKHQNRCSMCHYNLTGNTSGVCPECGTAIMQKAGA